MVTPSRSPPLLRTISAFTHPPPPPPLLSCFRRDSLLTLIPATPLHTSSNILRIPSKLVLGPIYLQPDLLAWRHGSEDKQTDGDVQSLYHSPQLVFHTLAVIYRKTQKSKIVGKFFRQLQKCNFVSFLKISRNRYTNANLYKPRLNNST